VIGNQRRRRARSAAADVAGPETASGAPGAAAPGAAEFFAPYGQIGRDLTAVDWAATPLGAVEGWPQSLKTIVQVVLSSRFSMWMAWGPTLTFFANEAYRRDTLGAKYPWALGRPASEVWAEIWPDIGPRIEAVMTSGVASWDESLQLFLERNGYREETYHTFSYSPLSDDDRQIVGMLCVVVEETDRVLGEQRLAILRDFNAALGHARSLEEVFAAAERQLSGALAPLPFSAAYLFDDESRLAHLVARAGVGAADTVAPDLVEVDSADAWPLADAAAGVAMRVEGLAGRFEHLPSGVWEDPPASAYVVPLRAGPHERPYGAFVAGLNPYRPFDAPYADFIALVAGQLSASVVNARAYEAERHRAEELAELDRAKTTFFTNVSHEFRTPLTLLLGPSSDALSDEEHELNAQQRARVELIQRNAERLLKLVNTLLDFSRLESGRVEVHAEAVDVGALTTRLAEMFRPAVEHAGLELRVEVEPLGHDVLVDREMWTKICLNLLSNALKFTFAGEIAVRLAQTTDPEGVRVLALEVADTGIGIAAADQAHLFERFHRVQGARSRSHEGSGIGLALVAELAALHGGAVSALSAPGVGTTFTVSIPVQLPSGEVAGGEDLQSVDGVAAGYVEEALRWLESGAPPGEPSAAGAPSSEAPRPRVLVADDNADMRRYVTSLLGEQYEVEAVADGALALESARRRPPSLVLTDVVMPNLDGFGLLTALRSDPLTAGIPVIMLSARAGEDAAVEGLDAGADDYLVKPFSALELVARVRSNLELERARREAAAQEHHIADELQRSLIPEISGIEGLEISTFYQAGERGSRVGGDWYDVIELGAGRTAIVIGDVVGRGVRSAAVMGQLRTAVRAFASLDLDPGALFGHLDTTVRDLRDGQIATCVYAVHDAAEETLEYALAGHLPPIVAVPGAPARRLAGALGPPLGTGPEVWPHASIPFPDGSMILLYTDGLVERRDVGLDERIDSAVAVVEGARDDPQRLTSELVEVLSPEGSDDDIALLVARTSGGTRRETLAFEVDDAPGAIGEARRRVIEALGSYGASERAIDALELITSELVTNAVVHGGRPVSVRLRLAGPDLHLEVSDGTARLPRLMRPGSVEEHGRGVQLVARLARRWGVRLTESGKTVWSTVPIGGARPHRSGGSRPG